MGTKNKIQYLNEIDTKVKDLARELVKVAVTSGAGTHLAGVTTFAVDSVTGFNAGDEIYIYDGTANSSFTTVNSIVQSPKQIKVTGNFSTILSGATIKKTDAVSCLDEAVNIYSKYRPLERIYKPSTFTAGTIFDLAADWEQEFSKINYVENPIDAEPPIKLDEREYEVFLNDSNVYKLRFKTSISSTFRKSYTIRHSFSSANPGVLSAPDNDFHCIANIASAKYLLMLAARYGQNVSPLIEADSVSFDNKTDQYRRLAKVYFGQAANWLGITVSDLEGTDLEEKTAAEPQKLTDSEQQGALNITQNQIFQPLNP